MGEIPDLEGSCGNQDFLTNLLVYQYLSGSIPGGGGPVPSSNIPLKALLASSQFVSNK